MVLAVQGVEVPVTSGRRLEGFLDLIVTGARAAATCKQGEVI